MIFGSKITHKNIITWNSFFLNFFVLKLIGASYLGIGIWLVEAFKIEKSKLDLIKEYYTSMGAIMITAGALCVFLCLVGYVLSCWRRLFLLISVIISYSQNVKTKIHY